MKSIVQATAVICGFTFCAAVSASAALESQMAAYSSSTDLMIGEFDSSFQLMFPKFDTTLGTLTDLVISLTTMNYAQAAVVNFGAPASFQNARTSVTVTISGAEGIQTSDTLATTPFSGTLAAGPSQVLGPTASDTVSDSAHVSPANFAAYEAAGGGTLNYVLDATASGTSSGTGGPGVFFGFQAGSHVVGEIDYYYTPEEIATVPESGTGGAGWMAVAICGYGVLRRQFPKVRDGKDKEYAV